MTSAQIITPDPRQLLVPGKGTVHNRMAQVMREGEREQRTGQFESSVSPIPDPDDWFSARV